MSDCDPEAKGSFAWVCVYCSFILDISGWVYMLLHTSLILSASPHFAKPTARLSATMTAANVTHRAPE